MIRDAICDLVARNRYRWFGRHDACILPNSDRFLALVSRPETAGRWHLAPADTKEAALLQFDSVPDAGKQLKALGQDDYPNVGNLIGYSYRKPGDYKFSHAR
jgi:hypothetical protein